MFNKYLYFASILLFIAWTLASCGSSATSPALDAQASGGMADSTPPIFCNGFKSLCDRRLDQVVLATAHNAMSNQDEGWLVPNQDHGLITQLDDGIRGFMIDVHPYDGDDATQTGKTYLCHSSCTLGAEDFAAAMTKIRVWLDEHPHEIISFILEDYVPEAAMNAGLDAAGMLPMCWHQAEGQPFPTLRTMINSNQRIFIMTESGGGALPWNHGYQTFAWDTDYANKTPADFSCARLRGKAGNPLFVINHFITNPLASKTAATQANANPLLADRLQQCLKETKQLPNFVAVDFYDVGDLIADVAALNALAVPSP